MSGHGAFGHPGAVGSGVGPSLLQGGSAAVSEEPEFSSQESLASDCGESLPTLRVCLNKTFHSSLIRYLAFSLWSAVYNKAGTDSAQGKVSGLVHITSEV